LQLSAQRGPRLHPHPHLLPLQRLHLLPLQHLHLLLLHLRLLLHQHQHPLLPRRAKPTNCFRQLFDDWLPSTKLISMH
jgi:hypothetical protein